MTFTGTLDARFGQTDQPLPWETAERVLLDAELYWLSTVRVDGRPHVTPLVGLWTDETFVFCTGPGEQKAHNLGHTACVAVTTGVNTWSDGVDVVVEGTAERVTGRAALTALADTYRTKYHGEWDFACDDQVFDPGATAAHVFRVTPAKVLAFAKSPHGQTRFLR